MVWEAVGAAVACWSPSSLGAWCRAWHMGLALEGDVSGLVLWHHLCDLGRALSQAKGPGHALGCAAASGGVS